MDIDPNIFSIKREIKNEPLDEESHFDPEYNFDFDCFKKEEEEVSEILEDSKTFLNLAQDFVNEIENLTDGSEAPRDEFEKIRLSEFPIILLKKLDINIYDKIRISTVNGTDYAIKIYPHDANEIHFEEDSIDDDSIEELKNYKGKYATRGRKERKAEYSSYSVGSPTESLPDKKLPNKMKKRICLKNSKAVDKIRNSKNFRCCFCIYRTNIPCNLKRHLKIHVGSVLTYNCSKCPYSTIRKDNLKIHVLNHLVYVAFKCFVCTYKTNDERNFKRHMLIHSEEKLFKCRLCDFKTNYSYHLKTHEFNHSGKKQFTCSECSYKTNYKKNLVRHVLIHTGTKAYKCDACGYKTNDVGHLKRHKKRHFLTN